MPSIVAEFEISLTPGTPEYDILYPLLKAYSLTCLRGSEISAEDHVEQSKEIAKQLVKCFADNPWTMDSMKWDLTDFLTQDEIKAHESHSDADAN